jgi:flagellar biosynthesis protein FliP
MRLAWLIGNADDFREKPARVGVLEAIVLLIVLIVAVLVIGVLILVTWFVRLIVSIAEDPNASPYRQVR